MNVVLDSSATLAWIYGDETTPAIARGAHMLGFIKATKVGYPE